MSTQSKLENLAIGKRDSLVISNEYQNTGGLIYDENHSDAKSNGDPNGKGNGITMGYAIADPTSFIINPDGTRVQKINYSSLITTENGTTTIGGEYDRNGVASIPKSGRFGLETINKYNSSNEYSIDSIDTTANVALGQYQS